MSNSPAPATSAEELEFGHKVRQLLQVAETAHKARQFHEAGAYLQAADLALHKWITAETARAQDKLGELKRWGLPVESIAMNGDQVAPLRAGSYSHSAGGQVAPAPARNGNSTAAGIGAARSCQCGHNFAAHNFGATTCEGRDLNNDDCECDGFELAPDPAPPTPWGESIACESGNHKGCLRQWCDCSCHLGRENPAGRPAF